MTFDEIIDLYQRLTTETKADTAQATSIVVAQIHAS